MTGKGVVRSIKNYAKGFSDVQRKVREATSNDPWGPSGTLMNEIAQLTYNQHDFIEIMDMIDKRLNDKGKNWRHVFKALLLLDYCLHVGSENVVLYAKENIYVVKTLKEFQHIDDNGRDVGANVRQKAKDITNLLTDDSRLREERRQRQQMRDRMAGVNDYLNDSMGIRHISDFGGAQGYDTEDRDLQRAIEESKRMAEAEERKRREQESDEDLARAIRLSEEEAKEKERKQREKLERENQEKLFGSGSNGTQTSSFNPFPVTQTFDASLNPYAQQQQPQQQWPQNTGMTSFTFTDPLSANTQQQQQWPQNTGTTSVTFNDPISANTQSLFPQTTGNPYQQHANNPYQQFGGFGQNLQAQMTGMPQQSQLTGLAPFQTSTITGFQQPQPTGSNNPFAQFNNNNNQQQQRQQQQQTLQPQATGAFATSQFGSQQQQQTLQPQPTSAFGTSTFGQTLSASPTFTPTTALSRSPTLGVFNPTSSATAGQSRAFTFPSSAQGATNANNNTTTGDSPFAKLNALLANREDGMDTFGNTGDLRVPTYSIKDTRRF